MQIQGYKYLSYWNPEENYKNNPKTQVVTCFLYLNDRFLILQRARNDAQHNLWGIPGGKLDNEESPLGGLAREIKEETQIESYPDKFELLGAARSKTPSDGEYGLYLYAYCLSEEPSVQINPEEHHSFRWVTMEEFEALSLLTAQREAYLFVKDKLQKLIDTKERIHVSK